MTARAAREHSARGCEWVPRKDPFAPTSTRRHRRQDGLDRRIREVTERLRRRLLSFAELAEVGATKKAVLARCWRGTLERVHDGVYLVGAGPLTWQEIILAGVLAGGTTSLASHFSALRLWGLGNFAPWPVHVTVTHSTSLRADGVATHRTRRSIPSTVIEGVPVVCVEEALLGVAPKLNNKLLHQLLTSAWRRRLTTPTKVVRHLEKNGIGVSGRSKLRAVAQLYIDHSKGPGSEAEANFVFEFYEALDAHGIERPELQHVITVANGTERLVPDFTWPLRRKVVEMKGLAAHGNYVLQDEDAEREALIRAAGWDLEIVTPRSMRDRKERTTARLIAFLQKPNHHHWPDPLIAAARRP